MLKPIIRMLAFATCIFYPGLANGGILTAEEAKEVATDFFQNADVSRLADVGSLELVYVEKVDTTPRYYIFNATDKKGFIIVSADDTALPVMAYSTTSAWLPQAMPEAAERLLETPASVLKSSSRRSPGRVSRSGRKLLNTPTWSQEAPFNSKIPNRPLVGCVGTALAEILKYHQYPVNRPSSLVKEGETATYDWSNMRNDNYRNGYNAVEGDAVGTLVADAAIAIGTDFGMSSSSAFEVKVPSALITMFGYDAGVSYKKGSEMDRDSWDALIVNEIDENRPVLYCGQDVSAGHAFVCDGYEMMGPTVYLHINWGWAGGADGFYASDALNPTMSKTYNFNNLTTVVYNIKPASSSAEWSPIHLTSDENQVGMTMDVTDIQPGTTFKVRAGALKNISNNNFSGSISLGLFSADGTFKRLLCDGKNFGLSSLNILKYTDISCTVPADAVIDDGDVIRLVTKDNTSSTWLPVANDLITLGEARAKGNNISYFNISFPAAVEGAEITYTEPRVIKGRDFSFKVVPTSPEDVVTVKANGFILTPNGNAYNLSNVTADQTITVIVQNAADVVSKRTLWVQAGKLSQLINDTEAGTVTDLTLYGTIDATDFTFMRDRMKLSRLDISGVSIKANGANPANAIPAKAFSKCGNLRQIVLPKNINTFKSGCFSYSGLTSIEIPASVATYEYNIFLGCGSLREVTVRRSAAAWVNWCVFQGTPKAKLIVPVGATAAHRNKDYWKDFKEIEEQNPVADSQYTVTIQDAAGIKFTAMTESTEVAPGSQYEFKVDTDDSFGDATVELYANNTRLYPGENGLYKATINSNTLIHANFRQPEATWPDSPWKITGAAGGVGLVTDVVNVVPGKSFTIRANALGIPSENADQFYCVALTDKDGGVKEIISPVIYNSIYNYGNQPCNFVCQVKDATVREGNLIRVVSSLDKKKWSLVNAANDTIADRISAIGNRVVYYNINMPQKVEGASIQGGATQVVRGMPFSLKVTPVSVDDRVTVSVNGINKVVDAAIANISIPAVVEDLEINIQVNPKGSNAYTVVNVKEGELDAKIAQCPARLKVIGVMRSEDFDAFRKHAATIVDLDLADVTIKGAGDLANAIPSKAFASTGFVQTALKTIILPTNLVNIEENAFYRCVSLSEVTIPASVTYVGDNAFSSCARLSKIVTLATAPPATGYMSPFPANTANITLEVPKGAESHYSAATFWNELNMSTSKVYYNIQIDPERSFNYNTYYQLTKIDVSKGAQKVTIGLPNFAPTSYKDNPTYRPGIAFKLYDNDKDVTTTTPYLYDGQHSVVLDPDPFYKPGSAKYPQDHIIRVVFHYPIEINCPAGIKAEFVDLNESNIWRNADMSLFIKDSQSRPNLFKEGENYKFKVISEATGIEAKVKCVSHVLTKFGDKPEFTDIETILTPDENGVYTISNLQGSIKIDITASIVVSEGSMISSGELGLVSEEEAKNITNIGVSGELDNAAFTEIRDKFKSLETLNLSELTNEEIPANAFLDMSSLKSVVIPENVVTIGSGAFAGCENLESVTLPGVEAIGDGAFDGCSNLTSITMLGKSADNSAEAVSRAPRKARLTEDAFRGINPNCLIYIPEDSGIELGTMRNVIVNQGSSRVADTDIVLEQGYPFNAPASFSLGANSISITIDIPGSISDDNDGWKGVILPFAPDSVAYGEEFVPRGEKVLNLLTLNSEEGDTFTSADSIVANRPYLANLHAPFATVPVTFIARGKSADSEIVYDVNYTPLAEEMSVNGRGLTLYGAYGADNDKSDVYVLDENGVAFRRAATDSVAVTPFSVFVCPSETQLPDSVAVGSHPLWVFNPAPANDNGFKLYRSGSVELLSETAGSTIYYTVDGSDPASSETRIAYDAPFSLESDTLSINAVAEYKGYLSDAVNMVYELRKTNVNYSLEDGWNWISHNVENEIPVESIISDNVDRVVSQTEEAIRDPQFGVVGNLNSLNPLEAYKVFTVGGNSDQAVSGVSFDPSVPVALKKGWNWIGCPMENSCITVADAFVNLEAEEGDMIVGREGFAQADTDGNWIGDLQQLALGQGYMYLSGSVKEFNYNAVPSHSEVRKNIVRENTKATWTIESSKYPSVMPITSHIVKDGGIMAADGEFEIGAFCGDECRGIGVCVEGWTMISVFGNPGDEISFRILSTDSHSEHALPQTLTFTESPVGSLKSPFVFNASATSAIETVDNGAVKVIVENGNIEISGDTQSVELVEVYDIAGVKEAAATNADKLKFENLKTGVHIVVIYTADGHISRKVEVK